MSAPVPSARHRLLRWYNQEQRDLPWRQTQDPYAIWIAETMLQQTQVKTVLPYYRRFLRAFATLAALDRAPRQAVLALWSGLGYYRRAENLKRAARIMMRKHAGEIPRDFAALRTLPGVGPYTAAALMSIAFQEPYLTLDGNARRVLARLFDVRKEKELREIGGALISRSRPGDFNQALMELGSTVCLSRDPRCQACPVDQFCAARRSGRYDWRGPSSTRRRVKEVDWPMALIQRGGKVLLRRRPPDGLLGGLWEVPGGERKRGESLHASLTRHLEGLGRLAPPLSYIGEVRHSITYRRIRAPIFLCSGSGKRRLPDSIWRWVSFSALKSYPLSSLSRKAIELVRKP